MSICAQWAELFEDKKCRICGLADMSNINIFNDKILRMKISTVYPIVLHQNDPLPRNICRKCVSTVSSMYNDIQKVLKLQNKWTQNVRAKEPYNSFLQALDFLENATEAIKNLMNATFSTRLPNETINRLITAALSEVKVPECSDGRKTNESLPLSGEKQEIIETKKEPITDKEEKEDLSLLKIVENKESSLSTPSPLTVMCSYCPLQFESLARMSLHQNVHLRLRIPKLFQTKFLNKKLRRGRLISVKDRQSIRCLNCWRIFNDNKCILEHWSKAECDFYCQICGKEFEQSPKMLREHILVSHGISYKSLKAQRDRFIKRTISSKQKHHSDFATNKSLKNKKEHQTLNSSQVVYKQNNTETSNHVKATPSNKLVVCRICSRAFQNFKACNSHMRAHKPPYAYGETAPFPDVDADAYMELEHTNFKKESPPTPKSSQTTTDTLSNGSPDTITTPESIISLSTPQVTETAEKHERGSNIELEFKSATSNIAPPQTATKITTSTAPRGIRMKFVSRRSDLNGSGPSIKVKSLSDLQAGQENVAISDHLSCSNPSILLKTSFINRKITNEQLDNIL